MYYTTKGYYLQNQTSMVNPIELTVFNLDTISLIIHQLSCIGLLCHGYTIRYSCKIGKYRWITHSTNTYYTLILCVLYNVIIWMSPMHIQKYQRLYGEIRRFFIIVMQRLHQYNSILEIPTDYFCNRLTILNLNCQVLQLVSVCIKQAETPHQPFILQTGINRHEPRHATKAAKAF